MEILTMKKINVISMLILALVQLTAGSATRNRRSNDVYRIDVLVAVDSKAFSKWLQQEPRTDTQRVKIQNATAKVKDYVSLVIRQVNDRLQTLSKHSNGWSVQMSVADFGINVDPLSGSTRIGTTVSIDSQVALQAVKFWSVGIGHAEKYDHVLVLTGENLNSTKEILSIGTVRGIAYVGQMCDKKGASVSVVEERGGFQSVGIVAHEIAHSLGSIHDGEGSASACPGSDRYIMAANSSPASGANLLHPWYFSACSVEMIGTLLSTPVADCLKANQSQVTGFEETVSIDAGLKNDANKQCQMIYGSTSRICLGSNFGGLSSVCTSMYCLSSKGPSQIQCLQHVAAEGTPCDDGKLCIMGECVSHPKAPAQLSQEDCPYGDDLVLLDGKSPCNVYIPQNSAPCYDATIANACCDSCAKVKKNSQVCPYGDRKSGCTSTYCSHIFHDGTIYAEDCCGTCSYDTPLSCVDADVVDGYTCPARVNLHGIQHCYDTFIAFQCCATCRQLRKNVTDCEYGDRTVDSNCDSLTSYGKNCVSHSQNCCQTCPKKLPNSSQMSSPFEMTILIILTFIIQKLHH